MKVLITGGAGYIGSAITKELCAQGCFVTVFDDLSEGNKEKVDPKAQFIEGNVLDTQALEQAFKEGPYDAVIHCAAKKVMYEGEENPTKYFTNNVGGTVNVLSAMERHKVPKIIFSSTAAVYAPVSDGHPVIETDQVEPQSVYGRSKLMCEMLIKEYARLKKIDAYIILRYFNVAGDTELFFKEKNPHGVFPLLARAFQLHEPFNIFGTDYPTPDGSPVRDYIHLADLVQAHELALRCSYSGTYNLGTSSGYSVYELVASFERATGMGVAKKAMPRRAGDVAIILANAEKAREELGWSPKRSLDDMVQSVVAVYGL